MQLGIEYRKYRTEEQVAEIERRSLEARAKLIEDYAVDELPKGWKEVKGASTAPRGYKWYYNGESFFNGKREHCLVKDKEYEAWEKKQHEREVNHGL